MPYPKEWFTHSLGRKIPHEPYIPIHPLEIMPQLRSSKPIPGIMLSEVPGFQHFIQHNLPYFSFGGTIRREAGVRCKPLGYINAFPSPFRIQVLNPFFRNHSETWMADSFSRTFAFSNICLSVIIINISFYLSNI